MRYRLQELLGAGGQGQVYRAWDERLERPVALKLLRRDGDPRDVERMLREARAQARVRHRHVCEVFEAGEEDGKPFVAMRLVAGPSLAVAAPELALAERVRLVRQVADALQAAHDLGLVHRDVKPGNVLLERDEAGWQAFVVDFGLAFEPGSRSGASMTATGAVLGTAAYMAPEQAAGDRDRVDRRSDVWSLGAVLFELVAGRPPFQGDSPLEVLMQVLQHEPPALRSLAPGVPRDLEVIVGRCLERDPARRYGSARLLAEDLDRFLAGEPILARPSTAAYRLWRRVRRHRLALAVGVGALLLGLAGAAKYVVDLSRERTAALAATARAEAARAEAEEMLRFLVDLFRAADPAEGRGAQVTVREALAHGAADLDRSFAETPATRARLGETIARVYFQLGLYDDALPLAERALAIRAEPGGGSVEDRVAAETLVAEVRQWRGDVEAARQHLLEAVRRGRAGGQVAVKALYVLAEIAIDQGNPAAAERLLRQVVAASPGAAPSLQAEHRAELARAVRDQGRFAEAEELFAEALRAWDLDGRRHHPNRITLLENLGLLYHDLGRFVEARDLFTEVLALRRATVGEDHPLVAVDLNNLARVYRRLGDDVHAEETFLAAMALYERTLGAEHPWVAIALNNLGSLDRLRGRWPSAEARLERARSILARTFGEASSQYGITLVNLGRVHGDRGRLERAGRDLELGLAVLEKANGPAHGNTAAALGALAELRRRQRRAGEAVPLAERAAAIRAAVHVAADPRRAEAELDLAESLEAAGRSPEAEAVYARVRSATEGRLAAGDDLLTRLAAARAVLGLARVAEAPSAPALFAAAHALLAPVSRVDWVPVREMRAEALAGLGRPGEARREMAPLLAGGYLPRRRLGS